MFRWFGGLLDRIFAAAGAGIFAQAPLFMQQYTQQLIAREAELKLQIDAMSQAANLTGKSLEELIKKFLINSDVDVVHQGEMMSSIALRWHNLSDALIAMQESSFLSRPFGFLYHLNPDVFTSTFFNFKIGFPLSLEGGIYALIGIATGYLSFMCLKNFFFYLGRMISLSKSVCLSYFLKVSKINRRRI